MPVLNGTIEPEGALVDVLVGLSRTEIRRLHQAARPVPAPVTLRALLDTGADCACIDLQAAAPLVLPLGGITLVNMPGLGGLQGCTEHEAGLTVLHPSGNPTDNWVIADLSVADQPLGVVGYQVLIGRDILALAAFLYNGKAGTFTLDY
jgi:hypothetical protein